MELEVSYNETYCVEGRAERRRGVPESVDGGGEVVGMVCVHLTPPDSTWGMRIVRYSGDQVESGGAVFRVARGPPNNQVECQWSS